MDTTLLSSEKNGYRLKISYDDFTGNPREEFDNVTTMFCFHDRYLLGDNQGKKKNPYKARDFDSIYELVDKVTEDFGELAIVQPLYLYDHSVQSISTSSFVGRAQHAEWDSGMVGIVFVTKAAMESEFGEGEDALSSARKALDAEVKLYDTYIRGEVYAFTLEKLSACGCCGQSDDEMVASGGMFYGYGDWKENGLLEMVGEHVDDATAKALVEALA